MSVVTYINTQTDKVGLVAPPTMLELKNCHAHAPPIISAEEEKQDEEQPGQADIWNLIQSQKPDDTIIPPPYVHPLVRRSSSSLSQKSLEICTENLGSESGSDDFLASFTDSETDTESEHSHLTEIEESEPLVAKIPAMKMGPMYVTNQENPYHCPSAAVSRKSPPRNFPPPLPSISNPNGGPSLRMRPYRCGNGRLVMEAVSVPTQNYLHARRHDGRLMLSFTGQHAVEEAELPESKNETESEESEESEAEEIEMEEESEEEEEVEVVDRGTMIEVKVSTQPNQLAVSKRVHRSSLVINKFVGSSMDDAMTAAADTVLTTLPPSRRAVAMPTTAAAAVAAASALSASSQYKEAHEDEDDEQLLFVATTAGSTRRSKEELLHQMRRCSQLRRPLFIWEPRYIVTL